jgi:glycosyltransferase involved in cell wall biosynthesis
MNAQTAVRNQESRSAEAMQSSYQLATCGRSVHESQSKKYRLMLFTDSFIHGGTERQLVEVLRQIDRNRYDVMVGCLKKRGPFLDEVEALGVPIIEFPIKSLHGLTTLREFLKLVRFLIDEKVDLVHTFDFYSNAFAIPGARISRVPVVLASLREIVSQRRLSHRWISRFSCRAAHFVIANSEAAAKPIFGNKRPERRLEIIRNGIQIERYPGDATRSEMRSSLGISQDALVVGVLACPQQTSC